MRLSVVMKFILSNILKWSSSTSSRNNRLMILAIFFGVGYSVIAYELYSISSNTKYSEKKIADNNFKQRNDILDRNGHILATNIPVASLYANPKKIPNINDAVEKLATVIPNLDSKKLLSELSKDRNFVWIKRDITPELQERITALGLPGINFENDQKRVYTQGKGASHILGYVDIDNNGISGIEKYFDSQLNNESSEKPIMLSIDYRIQNIVSQELDFVIDKFSALGGAGIVVDVKTGETLAMVSKPDFDPHRPSMASPDQMFNRASLGIYEIGSVLKTLTFVIGFDTNTIKMNDVYNVADFTINKFRVKDFHRHDGQTTVPQLFMRSSNIGSATIALEVGKKTFIEYMRKLWLTRKLDIEINEKTQPKFPSDKDWNDLSLVTMSYGYGYSISPLHFVQSMIPVVNGGDIYPLTLLKRSEQEVVKEKVLSEETSLNMLKLLRLAVEKGTGRKAAVKGYLVGGKTGTANKLGKKGYLNNSRYSSFIATVPAINPQYMVFIFLDDPQGINETYGFATAGFTAAPVVGNIISRMGSIYGIQPYDEDSEEVKNVMHVDYDLDHEV